jgi:hypothetical protein
MPLTRIPRGKHTVSRFGYCSESLRAAFRVLARGVAALLVAVVLSSCGAPQSPAQTVRGVLLDVQSSSISRVSTLRLRADDGRELDFTGSDELARDLDGSPGHLRQHMARVDSVTVFYRETPKGLVADRVQDTP